LQLMELALDILVNTPLTKEDMIDYSTIVSITSSKFKENSKDLDEFFQILNKIFENYVEAQAGLGRYPPGMLPKNTLEGGDSGDHGDSIF